MSVRGARGELDTVISTELLQGFTHKLVVSLDTPKPHGLRHSGVTYPHLHFIYQRQAVLVP